VNSISALFEINKRLLSGVEYALPLDPKDRSLIDPKAQISIDSIVGSSSQVSERAIIKRSTIGHHCNIGRHAKIINCILLDHCIIEEGVKLDSCILGKNSKIGTMSELTRCSTQAGYEVICRESIKGEKLEILD
jgi:translation initiation factor eIF-2B subunit gamma